MGVYGQSLGFLFQCWEVGFFVGKYDAPMDNVVDLNVVEDEG